MAIRSSLASVVSASILISAAAQAGTVTVKYRVFPDGGDVLPSETVKGSVKDTAKATIYSKTAGVTYDFLFWDVGGALVLDRTIDYTPPKDDFATAWYLQEGGGGGKCQPNCAVGTWAFTLTGDRVLKGATPIGSVTPASAGWSSPSTSVSTMGGAVTVDAAATVASPRGAQSFVHWVALGGKALPGKGFTVPAQTDSEDIGFFRLKPPGPAPTPKPPCPPKVSPYAQTCY